jgi:hypothetical protein
VYTVLAHLCHSLDEFVSEVADDEKAQVKLEALEVRRNQGNGHAGAAPVVRIVVTAAIPGPLPRWLSLTEELSLISGQTSRDVARRYAAQLISKGLRPTCGQWRLDDVYRMGGNGGFTVVPGRVPEGCFLQAEAVERAASN